MGVEAVVFFDPAQAWELELRRKRGAHLFSKHRFLSAQMDAYVTDGLWLRLAEQANAAAADLAAGIKALPGASLEAEPAGNMIFAHIPRGAHKRAMAAGAKYYLFPFNASLEGPEDEPIRCRFVCDWSCERETVERLLALFRG
jgi:threonine aldolase